MSIRFDDKVAIVTGAGGGLGRSHALDLASRGAKVVVNDLGGSVDGASKGSSSAAEKVVEEIKAAGGEAIANGASVTDVDQVKDMVQQTMDAYGRIDILVNNAGITRDNLLLRMDEEAWNKVIDINLNSCFNLTKCAIREFMKKKEGVIINISSIVGVKGNAGQSNYSASKAGINGFTKSIALELGSRNIRCNAIAPGFIETDMTSEGDGKLLESWIVYSSKKSWKYR